MRRVNWTFAAGLIVCLAAAAGGFHALHVVRYGRIADELGRLVEQAREDARPDDAIKFAAQYLEFRPDDTVMMADLATWLREKAQTRKQFASVLGLYERILRHTPDDRPIRIKAAELNMALGAWAAALDNLDALLRSQSDDAQLCEDYGYCLQAVGKYDEAADWYRKAARADPHRVTAYVRLAALLQQQLKRPGDALPVVEQAVEANSESGPAHVALAQFLRAGGKLREARDAVRKGLTFAPDDAQGLLVAADIEQASGNAAEARALLETGSKKYPKNSQFVCGLAWQLLTDGRADRAIATLREAKAATPRDVDVLTLLGDLLAQDGQVGPLEDAFKDLTDLNAPVDRVQYIQARLLMRRGRWGDAAALLDRLRMGALRTPALYRQSNLLLAQCGERLGDAAAELDAYRRLLDHDPNAGSVRLDYARALARAGRSDAALSQFMAVVPRAEVSSRAVAAATRALADLARPDPKAFGRLEKAIDGLKPESGNPNPALARAYLDLARYRAADSVPAIDGSVRAKPQSVALHVARAALAEQVFGLDRALAALADAEAIVGDQPDLRVARIQLLGSRLDPAFADALAGLGRGVERFGAEDRARILNEVIAAVRALGDNAAVGLYLDLLAQLRPDSLPAREALFARALKAGDEARRATVLSEVEAIEGPDGATAHLLDAQYQLWLAGPRDAKGLARAAEQLTVAAKGRANDPVIEFLRGRVAEVGGRNADALQHYQTAFDRGLADRPVEELFTTLTGKAGDAPVAVLRDQLPLADRLRPDRHRSLTVAALRLYDTSQQSAVADRLVAAAPPADAVPYVWLGRLFARLKLDRPAEEAFHRAAAAAPQSPDGWLALIAFQAARRNQAGTAAAAAEVRAKLPPIEAHLVVGRALESARQPDAARTEYEAAAALKPDDTRPLKLLANLALSRADVREARSRLEQIVALPTPSSNEDQAWARRTLAVQLARSQSTDGFKRALALVDGNKVNDNLTDDDLRARVLVLAGQGGRPVPGTDTPARGEAIRVLEALWQHGSSKAADDLILLARLYRADGDEVKAREARERIRTEYPSNYSCVVFLAREAIRDHDLAACERLLPAVRRLGPGEFMGVAVEFQCRVLSGTPDLGRRLLDDYVAAAPADQARAVKCADLIFEFLQAHPADEQPAAAADLRAAAIRLYRPAAEANAEAFQRLVTLLAIQPGGTEPAVLLVQRGRRTFGAEVAAAAYVQVHRFGRLTKAQEKALGNFLTDEIAKAPQSTPLLLTWAEYLQLTGENAKAVGEYRKVLQREPDNVFALNNLAWTLSLDRKDQAKVRESLAHIQRAIDLAGPLDELLDTRARILFESGQRDAGLRDMCEAVNQAPSSARLRDYAIMLRKAGKAGDAERALAEARRFGLGAAPVPR